MPTFDVRSLCKPQQGGAFCAIVTMNEDKKYSYLSMGGEYYGPIIKKQRFFEMTRGSKEALQKTLTQNSKDQILFMKDENAFIITECLTHYLLPREEILSNLITLKE